MSACDAQILLVSVVHTTITYGTPTMLSLEEILDDIAIPAAGVIGPSCLGTVRGDLLAIVEYLEKGHGSTSAAAGNLVGTYKDAEGDTITDTAANMRARGPAVDANRDSPPFRRRQRLRHVGDMATDPLT